MNDKIIYVIVELQGYLDAIQRKLPEGAKLTHAEREVFTLVYGKQLGIEPDKNKFYCRNPMSAERYDQLTYAAMGNGKQPFGSMMEFAKYFIIKGRREAFADRAR